MSQDDFTDYEKQRLRELLSGGDTFAHWHSEDRTPSQNFLHGLQQLMNQQTVSSDTALRPGSDVVFVDTSAGDVTITLPTPSNGQEYTIVKISELNSMIITTTPPATVNGHASATYTTINTARTFKAYEGDWNHLVGAIWDKLPHGSFTSTQIQTVATINTPTLVTFNVTDYSRGITLVPSDGLHVNQSGVYNIQFSCQLTNDDTQSHDMAIWLRKGSGSGTAADVPYTSSVATVPGTHGGQPGYYVIAANFFVYLDVGDFVEFWWSTNSLQVKMNTLPPITTPFVNPGSPAIVATLSYVSSETA